MSLFRNLLIANQDTPSRLPDGYTELDWIENTGNSWINTNYVPNANSIVSIRLSRLYATNIFSCIYSNQPTSSYGLNLYISSQNQLQAQINGTYVNIGYPSPNYKHKITFNKNQFYIDDILKQTFKYIDYKSTHYLYLFKDRVYNWAAPKCKLYSFEIKEGDKFIRNYIPCKTDSGEVGLFDLVENKFYKSESSKPFIAGDVHIDEVLSPDAYVRKDLIFQLDCKDAKPTVDGNNWIWEDRIRKIPFTMNKAIQAEDNGIYFNGVDSYGINSTDYSKMNFPYDQCTFEMCASVEGNNNPFFIMYIPKEGSFTVGSNGNIICPITKAVYQNGVNSLSYKYYGKDNLLMSINKLNWLSGEFLTNPNNKAGWGLAKTDKTYIGVGANYQNATQRTMYMKGIIRAIRIYNRILTVDEMKHNMKVDNKRFFGGTLW